MSDGAPSVLSAAQRQVAEHPVERPGVVEAGAGTGKTFTIVERVAALHENNICPADRILLLTFARKAAAELRARIARRLNDVTPTCSTFHSFAWKLLSDHAYEIDMSPQTLVLEDADARVEFRKAFNEFLDDPQAPSSGFPLRSFNCDEIRTALFSLDQRLKQEGISIDSFSQRALAAADGLRHIGYRELRRPYVRPVDGKSYKVVAKIDDEALEKETRCERQRVETCAGILRRFAARLAARSALTYGDILARAERALRENEELRNDLRRRYRCCIVDEYQDTDLAQHRLLEALFGTELASVMVVGDTLQSIFGFRGARPENVALFLRAPQSTLYTLVENRRSRQEILDLAHVVVTPAHDNAHHLVSERGPAGVQIVHVSTLWGGANGQYLPAASAREFEAQTVARRICQLLASGQRVDTGSGPEAILPRHIAILSRTKKNVQPVTRALLEAGVPFKLVGGVGFYDAPEIRDVLAWLRLLADPFDSYAVARALQSKAIDASDAIVTRLAPGAGAGETGFARRVLIDELPSGDPLSEGAARATRRLRELLDKLAPQAALPLLDALGEVIDVTGIEKAYRASSDPRADQAIANLTKLRALARSFVETTPAAMPADFVAFINELENVDFDEREADVSARDAVTIATIHAAKGLEWPFVFVLGVWPRLPNDPRLIWDDRCGALLYAENPDGSRSFHYQSFKLAADESGVIPREKESALDPEESRLFYVALTRARDRLFLSGLRGRPGQNNPQGKAHDYIERVYRWLQERHWSTDELVSEETLRYPGVRSRVSVVEVLKHSAPAVTPSVNGPISVPLSYSLIARCERCPRQATYKLMLGLPEVASSPGAPRDVPELGAALEPLDSAPPDSLLRSGKYGQMVHKALELWARDKLERMHAKDAAAYLGEASGIVSAVPSADQRRQAQTALAQVMAELQDWQPIAIEAPFTLDFGEEGSPILVSGFLDLLACDAHRRPCLIDYKTGEPSADHALQLALYQQAAQKVYGIHDAACFIGHIDGKHFQLQRVTPVAAQELHERVNRVETSLVKRDTRARPGRWCWSCGYRGAPCRDYIKKRQT
jgi:superfamily I DNA/RNA helicase